MKVQLEIESCLECPNHESGYDPDPCDSFNMDDMYCACKLLPNDRLDKISPHYAERQKYKKVTCGDRPYQLKNSCSIPKWCPIKVTK